MIGTLKFISLPLLALSLAACAPFEHLEQVQNDNARLLQYQALRLDAQEEYLAQLAESQDELTQILALVDNRARNIEASLAQPEPEAVDGSEPEDDEGADDEAEQVPTADVDSRLLNKQIVGRNEWVWLELLQRNLKARVDTGALSSSLSAVDLLPFERDGREWIRFRVPDEDHPDGGDVYEAPLIKYVKIRQASSEEMDRRPVVRLTARLGDLVGEADFNLSNRANMLYPVLLGRNFLRDVALVDVAQKFTQPQYDPAEESAQAP